MSNASKTQRDINLDVLRCLSLFFVLAVHFLTHCGIYDAGYTGLAAFCPTHCATSTPPLLAFL